MAYGWTLSKAVFVTSALQNLFSAVLPFISIFGMGMVIDALVNNLPYEKIFEIILKYIVINLAVTVISKIINFSSEIVGRYVSNKMQYMYQEDFLNINYHFVQTMEIVNLKKKSMKANPVYFIAALGHILGYILKFAGIAYILAQLNPVFIFVFTATSVISVILTFKTKKNKFDYALAVVNDNRKIEYLQNVMNTYKYAKEIRINRAQSFILNKYKTVVQNLLKKMKTLYSKAFKIDSVSVAVTVAQAAVMYISFSYQVYTQQITIAQYTVLLGSTALLSATLLGFFEVIATLNDDLKCADYYSEYRNLVDKNCDIIKSNKLDRREIDFDNLKIKLENVSFKYPNTDIFALKNINLEITKGEKIGIVGINGAGKTTLIKLISRLYDPTEGKITLNSIDIKEIPYEQYIKNMGIVLQDFLLFAFSVKENIMFDTGYDEKRLAYAIEQSGIENKINKLPRGLDTSVYKDIDENGIEFSGGEGQKLAFARAIYKNPDVLILDEPTSALDPIAEVDLFLRFNEIAKNKTTFFISHRLSSTRFCDKIIVLDGGEIIETGSHDKLMENGGLYKELFDIQADYYRKGGEII